MWVPRRCLEKKSEESIFLAFAVCSRCSFGTGCRDFEAINPYYDFVRFQTKWASNPLPPILNRLRLETNYEIIMWFQIEQNMESLLAKQLKNPSFLRQGAKIYVTTSNSVVRQDVIEISEQRTGFAWTFAKRSLKDCNKQHLQTTVSINLWKISLVILEIDLTSKLVCYVPLSLWEALKMFIFNHL